MLRHVAILLLGFASTVQAATVVVNNNIESYFEPRIGIDQVGFHVWKSSFKETWPGCVACVTSVQMGYENEILNGGGGEITLDEASDWFLVEPGDIFSVTSINAGQFPVIINVGGGPAGSGGPVTVGPGEFYLGVRTGNGFGNYPPGLPNRTIYGWVHMRPENGVLKMVENVMAYQTTGIIVGTTTVVPEPASVAIALIALATLATYRRRL